MSDATSSTKNAQEMHCCALMRRLPDARVENDGKNKIESFDLQKIKILGEKKSQVFHVRELTRRLPDARVEHGRALMRRLPDARVEHDGKNKIENL